jgi:diguanylate cyclase (GGDEF)-like protein/PAS domain S-box-containing protein
MSLLRYDPPDTSQPTLPVAITRHFIGSTMTLFPAHGVDHAQSVPPEPASLLRAVGDIMDMPIDVAFADTMVERLARGTGADYAWLVLDGNRPVCSSRCRVAGVDTVHAPTSDDRLLAAIASGGQAVSLANCHATYRDAAVLHGLDAQACIGHAITDDAGVVRGYLAFAFADSLADGAPYVDALRSLAGFIRHAVLRVEALENAVVDLRAATVRYEELFNRAPVLINAFDSTGRCTFWNASCQSTFGWSAEEIMQHADALSLFYPDPEIRAAVAASVGPAPGGEFKEWYPQNRQGEVLATLWSNVRLPDGGVVNIGMDITERKQAEAQLQRMAKTDGLTGCWNRAEIMRRLKERVEAAAADAKFKTTAVMIDLDHFKQVNDRHGHLAGDAALKNFCEQLRASVHDGDLIGRLGGEEFLVLLDGVDAEAGVALCDRLRGRLQAHVIEVGGYPLPLSASAGVTRIRGQGETISSLLSRADAALYEAKHAGRDRAVIARGA